MHVLNEDLDITGLEEVVDAAKLRVKVMDGIPGRTRKMIWKEASELSPSQAFPIHVIHFLNCLEESHLYKKRKGNRYQGGQQSAMPGSIVHTRTRCWRSTGLPLGC